MTHPSRLNFSRHITLFVALAAPLITGSVFAQYGGSGVSGIAEREIARRMGRIEDAKQAMNKGDELYSKDDHVGSLGQYRAAKDIFDQLPNAPYIQEWRDLANLKFADCAIVVAREEAVSGDYVEARKLIAEAEAAVPGHRASKILAKHLSDPDRWPPALTPQHVENVGKVKDLLLLANSYMEIGDYNQALLQYQEVLRIDPYNEAARRGMERTEQKREDYFKTARDHQRIRMLNMVNEAWEDKVPIRGLQPGPIDGNTTEPTVYLTRKMQQIVFPQVQFSGASIEEAIEFLRVKSRDLDVWEADPAKKGVNIILNPGDTPVTAQISLDLKDVPMVEALRYVTELAGMKYKVEAFAVLVVPASHTNTERYTRTYRVPPDFLSTPGGGGGAAPAAAPDPFATGGATGTATTGLTPRASAKDILTAAGIPFPDGTSAMFNPVTSQIIVTNSQPNLDLVESFVASLNSKGPKQIYITSKFVEVSQKNTDELGFDWLLGSFGSDVRVGGGTEGNAGVSATYPGLIGTLFGNGTLTPVTRGNRSGSDAIRGDSIDSLFNPVPPGTDTVSPGVFSVAGIFTDPQFAVVIRALSQRKGVDLMSAPSVTTKTGQRATIEVVREFIYPTEFDPPQIPTNVGATNGGGGIGGGTVGSIPVTPTTPTAFEMRPVGVRMEVDPVIGADGFTVDLNLAPEVTEFDGFINYGSPIYSVQPEFDLFGFQIGSTQIELTPNIINQPVFSTRKVQTSVTIWDGQTVALGGLIREDVQDAEDKLPFVGDLPFIGRLFRSSVEDHFKRNLMIFVTARIIDPAGQPINQTANMTADSDSGAGLPSGPGPSSALLPPVGGGE